MADNRVAKQIAKRTAAALALGMMVASFQNCSQMDASQLSSALSQNGSGAGSSNGGSGTGGGGTLPTATPVVAATPAPAPTSGTLTAVTTAEAPGGVVGMADPTVTGNKLQVCPSGCTYSNLSAAAAAMNDGDTVEIAYGDYVDCAYVTKNNIIIRGISNSSGFKPKIHDKTCGRKGILVISGMNILVDNLELSGARDNGNGDDNWAGVRFDSVTTAQNLKITNSYFHDNDNGILGNNITGAGNNILDVEDNVFEHLGRDGFSHGMYVGTAVTHFILRNNIVRSNTYDGHLVKTRALRGLIECNTIASLNGANSYALDIPQGGNYFVRGNTIEQGPNINNGSDTFIFFAEENADNAPHKLRVTSNYFVNDYANRGQIGVQTPADTSNWSSNIFAGSGGSLNLVGVDSAQANSFTNYASRAAAMFLAYDGTSASLPAHPVCQH